MLCSGSLDLVLSHRRQKADAGADIGAGLFPWQQVPYEAPTEPGWVHRGSGEMPWENMLLQGTTHDHRCSVLAS